jgi:hypothetical protein
MVTGSLSHGQSGLGVKLNTKKTSSAEVEEKVQLYLYSPSGPLWPLLGRNLPIPLKTDLEILNTALL